jgi:hypothetical protein
MASLERQFFNRFGCRTMNNSNNNSLGVFHWIRESVRRSVLLGFSDAVEQLGVPSGEAGEVSPHLMAVLRHTNPSPALPSAEPVAEPAATVKTERKRLGRSLDQLREPGPKTTSGSAS